MAFEIHELFLVLSTLFFSAAVFNLALYFGYHKKPDYLFFSFFCAFHIFKVWLKTFPQDQVLIPSFDLQAIDLIYFSVSLGLLSLNIFLLHHFDLKKKKLLILVFAVLSLISPFLIPEDVFIFIYVLAAIVQSILGLKKQPYNWMILMGLVFLFISTILGTTGAVPFGYFIGVIVMIILMTISSGIQLSQHTNMLNRAKLQSAKLENQLLKKSIQPHFILNSLTSLQELIEQDPKKASHFVQNLSRVFTVFSKVNERKLIPINDELELAGSFLDIMAVRMNKNFNLKVDTIDGSEEIPPGVLLTLIENGVTHGFSHQDTGQFQISKSTTDEAVTFTIKNNGDAPSSISEGVGIQYIRSRLNEAFGEKYSLQFQALDQGFQSQIILSR
ncbi:histidine kinase [Ekhidna sp. MALMAid0563]|uniref:sensor histidine kinase n=1 Tax=Ekhidna sp. MALMAid0563 TaxID=3143937 RepID=UPI0032DE7120